MLTTDESGSAVSRPIYTAFGEPVTYDAQAGWQVGFPADIGTRYGYDGGWGYESGLITLWGEDTSLPPVMLQHVGERWYQPGIGRFIQRDPIGLPAGMNLYVYCGAEPMPCADPSGEGFFDGNNGFHDWVARNVWLRFHSPEHINSKWATAEAVTVSVVGGIAIAEGLYHGGAYCIRLIRARPYRVLPRELPDPDIPEPWWPPKEPPTRPPPHTPRWNPPDDFWKWN